jgi:hypothetical protein
VICEEAWSLVWEGSSFATVISGAPSTSFTESGSSAFPRLGALLSTLPVVGLRDGAVLFLWSSLSVFGPVSFPEFFSVIVFLSNDWNDWVSETNGWWRCVEGDEGCLSGSDSCKCDEGKEFHYN